MKEITNKMEVVGRLFTGNREYDLLSLKPVEKNVELTRVNALSFYVRSWNGYGVFIAVKGDWIIEPNPVAELVDVKFVIDEEEVAVTSPAYLNVSETVE